MLGDAVSMLQASVAAPPTPLDIKEGLSAGTASVEAALTSLFPTNRATPMHPVHIVRSESLHSVNTAYCSMSLSVGSRFSFGVRGCVIALLPEH